MLHERKIVVVLPAYRAGRTLQRTHAAIPPDVVDEVILVDDASDDETIAVARDLGVAVFVHDRNLGYGANQKTCYAEALRAGADIVVMLHPDYQYEPRLITAMAGMIASGVYDVVLGSRILGNTAIAGGMPLYKYVSNRVLTLVENLLLGSKLSEFHTGYRAFSRRALESLPILANSDDFVFDNQILAQAIALGFRIGEISCPTRYFPEASSIDFRRSLVYGLGVLRVSLSYRLWKLGVARPHIFSRSPTLRLRPEHYARVAGGPAAEPERGGVARRRGRGRERSRRRRQAGPGHAPAGTRAAPERAGTTPGTAPGRAGDGPGPGEPSGRSPDEGW